MHNKGFARSGNRPCKIAFYSEREKLMKKIINLSVKAIATLVAVLLVATMFKATANASFSRGNLENKNQIAQTQTTVNISWDPVKLYDFYTYEGSIKLYVVPGRSSKFEGVNPVGSFPMTATACQISNLNPGTLYSYKIAYTRTTKSNGATSEVAVSYGNIVTLPGAVNGFSLSYMYASYKNYKSYDEIRYLIPGDNGEGACEYEIQYYNHKNKAVGAPKPANVGYGKEIKLTKVSRAKVQQFAFRPYVTINGIKYYGQWSNKIVFVPQPTMVLEKKSSKFNGTITIKWKKVTGATGYDVYMSKGTSVPKKLSKAKKISSLKSSKTSLKVSKFNKKAISSGNYYYTVIANAKVNKKKYDCKKILREWGNVYIYKTFR